MFEGFYAKSYANDKTAKAKMITSVVQVVAKEVG